MTPEGKPQKLRPTQIGVMVVTAFLMVLAAALFGSGLYCVLNPEVLSDDSALDQAIGVILLAGALIPAGGIWGMWMLWNDLATRTPGSAKKFGKKP